MYTNAAPDVIKFIDEQKKNGNLIDIYSDEWQKKQHIKFEFYRKNLQTFEKKNGYSYKGHMLVLLLNNENIDQIRSLYKPLEDQINSPSIFSDANNHNPDFLFINLFTKQILCAGLGKKNRLFLIDAETSASIDYNLNHLNISASKVFNNKNSTYFESFTKLDPLNFVYQLISTLEELGLAFYAHASCEFDSFQVGELLAEKPNSDGKYIRYGSEYDKEELELMAQESDDAEDDIQSAKSTLEEYFPEIDIGELNTGDY